MDGAWVPTIGDVVKFKSGPYKGLLARVVWRDDASTYIKFSFFQYGHLKELSLQDLFGMEFERQ